jgi:hypothetical protein
MRAWPSRALPTAASAALALAFAELPAHADPSSTAQQCSAAYDKAQVLRRARKLTAARDELLICSQTKCPAVITADCAPWLREVEGAMPSIVVAARDPAGNDVPAVKVSIDGALLVSGLTGAPLDVDPGSHTLTVEPEHGQRVEQPLLVNVGEKNRVIQVTIRPEAAVQAPADAAPGGGKKGSLVPGIVVGAVGLAAMGASLGIYLSANSSASGLRSSCAPHCNPSDVDSIRTKATASDVVWGVGAAAVGAGALMMIFMRPTSAPSTTGSGTPRSFVVTPLVAPLVGGAFAGLSVRL